MSTLSHATGLRLRYRPLAPSRGRQNQRGWHSAEQLADLKDGSSAWACGIVTMRQEPEAANGVIFVTLEDEAEGVNISAQSRIHSLAASASLR